MTPLWLKNVLKISGIFLILSLILSFGVHSFDFSHVHPNELVPHEHQEYAPVFSVHADEKSLWALFVILGSIGLSLTFFFFACASRNAGNVFAGLEVFYRKLTAPPPLAFAFSRGRIHKIE